MMVGGHCRYCEPLFVGSLLETLPFERHKRMHRDDFGRSVPPNRQMQMESELEIEVGDSVGSGLEAGRLGICGAARERGNVEIAHERTRTGLVRRNALVTMEDVDTMDASVRGYQTASLPWNGRTAREWWWTFFARRKNLGGFCDKSPKRKQARHIWCG